MYAFSSVVLVVLAVFGAVAFVKELTTWVFSRKSDSSVIIITPKTSGEEAEFTLRSALSKLRWSGKFSETRVMLNCELDENTKRICNALCREYGFKGLVSPEEIINMIGR